jgi:SNF2 family DNA or RNA helicase
MTELAPHQREAVARVRELLDRYGGALLADEVGLGKSFVAAALMNEYRGTEIELILPASLVTQWRETLREFDVEARVITHDALARAPFMADAARERLVIVDEAHAFRNRNTQRWAALARRSIGARLLLITATPICNSLDDLASLIHLIAADDALRDQGVHSIEAAFRERGRVSLAAITSTLVIRRERDVLPAALRFGTLESDVLRHSVLAASIDTLEFPLVGETQLLRRFLWRRLESSEEALLESVDRQLRFYDRARDALRRGRLLTKREYRRAFGEDDSLQQVLFWEVFAPPASHGDVQAIDDEVSRLRAIHAEVAASPRAKLQMLRDVVATIDDPLLIFTGHIATAGVIFAALRPARTCGLVTARNGRDAIDAFVRGRLDVLVTTDLAAEGLNLQRAGAVIHYDLPWNPVKIDQRNGRAHRIGQRRSSVRAIYFVPEEERTGTSGIVARKNETRVATLRPPWFSFVPVDPALPQHIPRDSAPASLVRALDRRHALVPPALLRRFRAGAERLMAEMAGEHVDAARLDWLVAMLAREREISSIRVSKGDHA